MIHEYLETHWENLIPYNCCAEAERQTFNLWPLLHSYKNIHVKPLSGGSYSWNRPILFPWSLTHSVPSQGIHQLQLINTLPIQKLSIFLNLEMLLFLKQTVPHLSRQYKSICLLQRHSLLLAWVHITEAASFSQQRHVLGRLGHNFTDIGLGESCLRHGVI